MAPEHEHPGEHGHEHEHEHESQHEHGRSPGREDIATQSLNEALRVSFRALKFAMVLVALMFLGSGIFIVKPQEQALVLRFGKVKDRDGKPILEPGRLYFAWPFLIDEVVRFPVQRQLSQTIDTFWHQEATKGGTPAPGQGHMVLTGDASLLHANWQVVYRVTDPVRFCERLADPGALKRDKPTGVLRDLMDVLLRNAITRIMGEFTVDQAYYYDKARLQRRVEEQLVAQLENLDVGIEVPKKGVKLVAVVPPRATKNAFEDVQNAEQDKDKLRKEAESFRITTENEAKGTASRLLGEARAYKSRVERQAEADAQYIDLLMEKYGNDPKTLKHFLEIRLIEVLEETQESVDERFVLKVDEGKGKREIRLMLSRDPNAARRNREKRAKERAEAKAKARATRIP